MKQREIITMCCYPHCDERSKGRREEDLAKELGIQREELMNILSHGMCETCFKCEMENINSMRE